MFEIKDEYYKGLEDKEIIKLAIAGNEEAMVYLLYVRYKEDIKYYTWQCFNSYEYYEDLVNELYIHLKGKNNDWKPLSSFRGDSKFRTWLRRVAIRLFLKKKKELIDIDGDNASTTTENQEVQLPQPAPETENQNLVILLEAINRLSNELYRFILIQELKGYNHKEIAEMLIEKRKKENKASIYRGVEVVPDARYIDMNKARALREVKAIVKQIKKEWYGI